MSVLTENELRKMIKDKDLNALKELEVSKKQIVTPSAISFLNDHNISLKYIEDLEGFNIKSHKEIKNIEQDIKDVTNRYSTIFGIEVAVKPEHMTQLYGNVLVFKDHKKIIFRGKLDSLESKLLEGQILCNKEKLNKLVGDLQEILDFVRDLVRCEILEEPVKEINLQGMNLEEIREKANYPKRYFGIGAEPVLYSMGEVVVSLNSIRTEIRETELLAYKAFKDEYGNVKREDIIRALNRLSSLLWIMIFKYRIGKYRS